MGRRRLFRLFYWLLLIVGPVVVYFLVINRSASYPDTVKDGVADLTIYDFDKNVVVPLEGSWECYPDEIIMPAEFAARETPATYYPVPHFWGTNSENQQIPKCGYATYRCKVLIDNNVDYLGLYYSEIYTAAAIYINGMLYDVQGQIGVSPSNSIPDSQAKIVSFETESDSIEIVIQVSNFHFRSGGINGEILLGEERTIFKAIHNRNLIKSSLIGGLIIIAFFQLGMAVLPKSNHIYYFFSFICLLLAFRIIILPSTPFEAIQKLPYLMRLHFEYLSFFIGIPVISGIMNALFPKDYSRKYVYLFFSLGVLFSILQYFLPVQYATWLIPIFQIATFVQGLLVTVILVAVIVRKRPDAYAFTIGWIMILAGLTHDILVTSGILQTNVQITPYLMFLFVFAQANVVAQRSSKAFLQVEELSDRLNFVNVNLEKLVAERTHRIEKQTLEMERQSNRIDQQNRKLQKTVEVRNQLLTIIGHDLRGPIGNIGEMADLILTADMDGESQQEMIQAIGQAATSSFALLENLMYWGRAQSGKVAYNPEYQNIREIAGEALNLLEASAKDKNINLENYIPPDHVAWCDPIHVNLVIRNLVNNAIKFTKNGGHIMVSSRYHKHVSGHNDYLEILVRDDGVGISPEKLEQIFSSDKVETSWGTNNEKGSGLGLQLVKQFVALNKGQIYARSTVGSFTTFYFSLPVKASR